MSTPAPQPKPKKSILESLWNDFTENSPIDDVVRGVGSAVGTAVGFAMGQSRSPEVELGLFEDQVRAATKGTDPESVKRMSAEARAIRSQQQNEANFGLGTGPLGIALGASEAAWSYGAARPAATGALLANPGSPLYKDGTVDQTVGRDEQGKRITEKVRTEAGFQLDDIRQAFNRSEDVTFGEAAVTNPINKVLPTGALTAIGGVGDYDPWSDYDMALADNNTFYNFLTGATDGALQIIVPPAVKVGRLAAVDKLGLRSTIKSGDDLTRLRTDWDTHRTWKNTAGIEGQETAYGRYIDELATETNQAKIRRNPLIANGTGTDKARLSSIIANTDDPDTVAALTLANMGDTRALMDLMDRAPDHVWSLADMDSTIFRMHLAGESFDPTGDALIRVNQVFESAAKRDEYFTQVRNTFLSEDGGLLGPGSTWMPSKSLLVEKIRTAKGKAQYAMSEADYTDAPRWVQLASQSKAGGPTTILLQYTGSRQPLGQVTRSGARPDDIWEELSAQMNSVPLFRGNRDVVVGTDLVDGQLVSRTMKASEYRQMQAQRLYEASMSGNLMQAWETWEREAFDAMADSLGVNRVDAQRFIEGFRTRARQKMSYLQENGYLFDEMGNKIEVNVATRRQMLDSFQTMPMDEIYRGLQNEVSRIRNLGNTSRDLGTELFDAGMKLFRTNVLFRPGYTGKNSIAEPLLSSWLAHGTILSDEGIASTMGNFARNRINNVKAAGYHFELDTYFKRVVSKEAPKTRRAMRKELQTLAQQRRLAEDAKAAALADLEAVKRGRVRPSAAAEIVEEAQDRLVDAQIRLTSIEDMLDQRAPEWRQIVEPASMSDVSDKLREYRAILGLDSRYVTDLEDELTGIYQRAGQRANAPRQAARENVTRLDQQIADVEAMLERYSTDYNKPTTDLTGLSVAGNATRAQGRQRAANMGVTAWDLYPELSKQNARSVGLVNLDFAERLVRDIQLTPEQRASIQELARKFRGRKGKDAEGFTEPIQIGWDPDLNEAIIDIGDGVLPILAAKAAGLKAIPIRMVRRQAKEMPNAGRVPLPEGSWLRTKRPEQKTPRFLNPSDVLPDQYGAIVRGVDEVSFAEEMIGGQGTRFTAAADDNFDLARGRDYQAIAMQRQRESLIEQRDAAQAELDRLLAQPDPEIQLIGTERARVERLEKILGRIEQRDKIDVKSMQAQYDELERVYEDIVRATENDLLPPNTVIDQADDLIQALERKMGSVQVELGRSREKYGNVTGMQGYYGSGNDYMTLNIAGERFQVPAAFSDRNFDFGPGYRAEASASMTNQMTLDPSFGANALSARVSRNGGARVIDPSDPLYWDELAHVANRQIRGDKLMQRILTAKTRAEVAAWLMTKEGKRYQVSMGRRYLTPKERYSDPVSPLATVDGATTGRPRRMMMESTTEFDELYRIIHQYFPDEKVRQEVAAGEVTAGNLQSALGGRTDLSRILAEDLEYMPTGPLAAFTGGLSKALDRIWHYIATMPEDRVARWPFYQREFRIQMEQRANTLADQGVSMTMKQLNAMRQASHRAALTELEKTFYNIRRYNTPIYTSRFLLSFPGAFFNSIYRYGRFATKEPERLFQTALFANDLITSMGIDENGNPVEDVRNAAYLLVPGTKSSATDTGLRIPVASFQTLTVNYPSLSWGMNALANTFVKNDPQYEEIIKNALGPAFNELFPYGFNRNPVGTVFGSWQKDLWRLVNGSRDTDFITTNVQIYADAVARWELENEKREQQGLPPITEPPSFTDAAFDTVAFYAQRTLTKFFNPFTTDMQPAGQAMRDAWYDTRALYPEDTEEARKYFTQLYGDWARWYTFSSSEYTAYLPSSQDAYERVWVKYPELTREITSVVGDENVEFVSLLTMGADGTFSQSVSNYMRDNPLPGDDVPVITRMQPEEFANFVRRSDGWAVFSRESAKYEAEMTRLRTLRDSTPESWAKDQIRGQIAQTELSFRDWRKNTLAKSNEPWAIDFNDPSGSKAKNAALLMRKIIDDPKFKANDGKSVLWQKAGVFLDSRDRALDAIEAEKDPERKKDLRASFVSWVNDDLLTEVPEFSPTWTRYFMREWADD